MLSSVELPVVVFGDHTRIVKYVDSHLELAQMASRCSDRGRALILDIYSISSAPSISSMAATRGTSSI